MKRLLIVIISSLMLFSCTETNIAASQHSRSKHEQNEAKFHKKINRPKDIIDNNIRKQNSSYFPNNSSPYNF